MELTVKPSSMRSLLVRMLVFGVFILLLRFVYVVSVYGGSCDAQDFCFFSLPETFNVAGAGDGIGAALIREGRSSDSALQELWTSREWRKNVDFYSSRFQDFMAEGFLSPSSKSLCIETPTGQDVFSLKEIGVPDTIGISKKKSPPLVISGDPSRQPFGDKSFDFEFAGSGAVERSIRPLEFAAEIARTLKPEGYLVIHTSSANDLYSFNSFLNLFNCCRLIQSREIEDQDSRILREIVMKKESDYIVDHWGNKPDGNSANKCSVPGYKRELVQNAEPLIAEEPLKPWITLKRNIKEIQYLPKMADISFKQKYVYIDVGARSYGSSIGSWFKKQYPKQNHTFEIYAIEADHVFHEEYSKRKGVYLLPFAAWVRNETLSFEISGDPGHKTVEKGRGMGRIRPADSASNSSSNVDRIQGFDFANWLKSMVSETDFVVMKMDVEGTEFDLVPRLFETGAICLIDEIFLECHYSRWQRCCPGERSSKYKKTYDQCLELFSSLRDNGVLVHQWW